MKPLKFNSIHGGRLRIEDTQVTWEIGVNRYTKTVIPISRLQSVSTSAHGLLRGWRFKDLILTTAGGDIVAEQLRDADVARDAILGLLAARGT